MPSALLSHSTSPEWERDTQRQKCRTADSKEPAKDFREIVARPHAALIIPIKRSGQELSAEASFVTARRGMCPHHVLLGRGWRSHECGRAEGRGQTQLQCPQPQLRRGVVLRGEGWTGLLGFSAQPAPPGLAWEGMSPAKPQWAERQRCHCPKMAVRALHPNEPKAPRGC